MLIRTCSNCKYHEIKNEEESQTSYCSRENCWSEYSKCLANKALDRFLKEETSQSYQGFTAIASVYPAK